MRDYIELSVPLASDSLTFFIGTGFSKYLTDGNAPNWLELVTELARRIGSPSNTLLNKLFNSDSSGTVTESKFPLEICSQILELEYKKKSKNIRQTVCDIISERVNATTISPARVKQAASIFSAHPRINIITTNYDTLLTDFLLQKQSRVLVEGAPIPRSQIGQTVYHIHGSVTKPDSIVLTLNDYFRFQHRQNYFSRKFYTLLQESTVVILGYSLGDFNLNSIFNEVQFSKSEWLRKRDIFLVTRDPIDETYKTFYAYTYGIDVVDSCTIDSFFLNLQTSFPRAQNLVDQAKYLPEVLDGSKVYLDDYLKLRTAFPSMLLQAANLGIPYDDPKFLLLVQGILQKKQEFTYENNAWSQYAHLAEWLVEIGSLLDLRGSPVESAYLDLVRYSFRKMSKSPIRGFSWEAFGIWEYGFRELKIENQNLINDSFTGVYFDPDVRSIIQ